MSLSICHNIHKNLSDPFGFLQNKHKFYLLYVCIISVMCFNKLKIAVGQVKTIVILLIFLLH